MKITDKMRLDYLDRVMDSEGQESACAYTGARDGGCIDIFSWSRDHIRQAIDAAILIELADRKCAS